MLWRICTLSFIAGFLLVSPVHADPDSAIQADSALLESLVTQNDAMVRKLESSPLYAEYTWRTTKTMGPIPSPDGADLSGPMVTEGRARYWRDGTSFCEDRDLKNTWPVSGRVRDGSNIFLINDRYAVNYRKRLHVLHIYHFDDRNYLYPAVKAQLEIYPYPDLLEFGTRYSSGRTLREANEQQVGGAQSGYRWTPYEPNAGDNLHYKIVSERMAGSLSQETLLDPRSGFLIAETRTYNKAGDPFYAVQAQFQQVADGMWFPKSVTRSIEQGNKVMTIEVQKVTMGDPGIGKMITLEALDIDPEITILHEHATGGKQRTTKGYLNGQWVSFGSLPPERRKAIGEAQQRSMAESEHGE